MKCPKCGYQIEENDKTLIYSIIAISLASFSLGFQFGVYIL